MEAIETAVTNEKPFFLYYTPTCPHSPGNEEALTNYSVFQTPSGVLDTEPITTMPTRQSVIDRGLSEGDDFRDSSIGTIWVDDALGSLMDGIESLGELNNTIFIVTMDHGQRAKDSLYEVCVVWICGYIYIYVRLYGCALC